MRSRSLYLLLLATSIESCAKDEDGLAATQASCEIASDYVKRFVTEAEALRAERREAPRKIGVSEVPYQLLPAVSKDGLAAGTIPSSISEVSDWRAIDRLPEKSVLTTCPALESWLSDRDVISDDEKIRSLSTSDVWEVHTLSIAMPIFTSDGAQAVIFADKASGGLATVGTLAIYAKDDQGEWQLIGEEVRLVS